MIDLKKLREQGETYKAGAKAKGVEVNLDRILTLDDEVRGLKTEIEGISAKKNAASGTIASAQGDEKKALIESMRALGDTEKALLEKIAPLEAELNDLLYKLPNPPLEDVPVGEGESANTVIRTVGEKREFAFTPKDHSELGEALGLFDLERGAKVSGARFAYVKGDGVLLQMALTSLALDVAQKHGFTPISVPHLVNAEAMRAMGYLEHGGQEEIYYLEKDDQYLIGTSEQAIGPLHMGETFKASDLPKRYVGISPCYRREAGSYGKDTKGMMRMHQFDKIEMFSFATPEMDASEHQLILSIEESLMQALEIPYHVLLIGSGDLGLPAAKKYDIEAWIPTQNTYRETHSCSTTTDFQARRLETRFKDESGTRYVHTLNGTAFALGRTMVALLENHQQEDGTIQIPKALQPYLSGRTFLGK